MALVQLEVMRKISERGEHGARGPRGRKKTAFGCAPRFQQDAPAGAIHAVRRGRAVMFAQWSEAPIGIRDHMDAAIAIHQNRQVTIAGAGGAGGGKNLLGVSEKRAHEMLIVRRGNGFSCKGIRVAAEKNLRWNAFR